MKTLKKLYLPLLAFFAMLVSTACVCIENKLPITKEKLMERDKELLLEYNLKMEAEEETSISKR